MFSHPCVGLGVAVLAFSYERGTPARTPAEEAVASSHSRGGAVEAEMDAVQSMFSEDIQDMVLEGPARRVRWLRVAIRPDVAGEGSHIHASLSLTVRNPSPHLIAASIYDKYSVGPSIRRICTRSYFTMTKRIQVCSNFH